MGRLDDILANDAARIFASEVFSFEVETVEYVSAKQGITRDVAVQVFRQPPEDAPQANHRTSRIRLFVPRSEIGVSAIYPPTDTFKVAAVKGQTATPRTVTRIVSEDAGGFTVELA